MKKKYFIKPKSSKMKAIVKALFIFSVIGSLVSCKSTFNANETMENQEQKCALSRDHF